METLSDSPRTGSLSCVLIFVDQSGDAHPSNAGLWSVLMGVCIGEPLSRELTRLLHTAVRAIYPDRSPYEIEVKAEKLLSRRQFEHVTQRRQLVTRVAEIVEAFPFTVFAVQMRRPSVAPAWPSLRLSPPYRFLTERVELQMRNAEPGGLAKMVFDERDLGSDAATSRCFRSFIHATAEGASWRHILDVPFFVASAITPGIQIADLLAGAVRLHLELATPGYVPGSDWERAVDRLWRATRAKTRDFVVGGETYFGMYFMPDRYYADPPRPRILQ